MVSEKVLRTVAADVYGTDGREPRELPEALRNGISPGWARP